jgi:hypothetical protein
MRPAHVLALVLSFAFVVHTACGARSSTLPTALSDDQFWALTTSLSEAAGAFPFSDNLVSNETYFVHLVRMLRPSGGVYIGVGPEQNFSYIAKLRPALAFIIDIREENRALHLMYKALFELSHDRADFLSHLFSRERPPGLGPETSVQDLFAKYAAAMPSTSLRGVNLARIRARLVESHRLPLAPRTLEWIDYAFNAFSSDGPEIHYRRSSPGEPPSPPYRVLMSATDVTGRSQSFLASEEAFAFVKDLHARNGIVPVVGDFAGPGALRRAGDYIRQHGEIVTAFYASNVEVYLNREKERAFCANLATLPHDARTWFVGSKAMQPLSSKLQACGR